MDKKDRQHIEDFEDVLVEKTNFKKVYTHLLRWQVIPVNLKAFESSYQKSDKENNKILYSVIKSRGSDAFSKLKQALMLSNPELLDQFEGRPWRISNEQWVCSPQIYTLSDSKIRGSYCIVTMTENRTGWEKEEENYKKTFECLRYEGSVFRDPSEKEFNDLLTNFTENKTDAGCYVFALSAHGIGSHGTEKILIAKKSYKEVDEILSRVCKAPLLLNKPKIIILQVCRGDSQNLPSLYWNLKTTPSTPLEIPDIKDTIILRPCLPGYVAYRDTVLGGWFVDILTRMIQKYAREKDVEEIMIEVSKELFQMKETKSGFYKFSEEWRYMAPCTNTYSFKKFYFLPKKELSKMREEGELLDPTNENQGD